MNLVDFFVIVLLILVNALYVAAEFAAVGVRRGQIRERAEKGSRLASGMLAIVEDTHMLDRYIAACQIGITFSSLMLGAYGQFAVAADMANWLEDMGWDRVAALSSASVSVLVLLTVLQVVMGELVPKSLALQFSTRTALMTYLPMVWSLSLFRWFIAILNGSGLAIVRLFGGQPGVHRHIHSPEEIDMLLAESADGGLLEPEEQERLHDAIRLSGRTARELMTPRPRVRMIDGDAGFPAIIAAAVSSPFTRMPVYRDDPENVVGFVHTRDLAAHVAQGKEPALEAVLRPMLAVARTTPVHLLLPQLRRRGQRIALVVDEFGSVAGVVTLQDVLDELLGVPSGAQGLPGQSPPERLPDGRLRIPGLLSLTDLYRVLGVDWRDRQVTTIGGLVLKQFAQMPKPGERVAIHGVGFEVERVERQTIASVLVTPPPEDAENGKEGEPWTS